MSAAGGVATPITTVDRARGAIVHSFPKFLPDGQRFLYLRVSNKSENIGIYAGSIDVKPEEQSLKLLMSTNRQAVYAAPLLDSSGRLLFMRDTTLFAQPFDPNKLELSGEAVPVADQIGSFPAAFAGLYSISDTGVLAYRVGAGGDQRQLYWYDDQGKTLGSIGDKGTYSNPTISPDGTRAAVAAFDRQTGNSNIWVVDLSRGNSTKVTFNSGRNDFPIWSPDGKTIVFASNRNGHMDLYLKNADGSSEERLVLKSGDDKHPTSWSRDRRFLLYQSTMQRLRTICGYCPTRSMREVKRSRSLTCGPNFRKAAGSFSPDGRWIAYLSTESGSPQIYVRPFYPTRLPSPPREAAGWFPLPSSNMPPHWRGDSKEIYYVSATGQLMDVSLDTQKSFQYAAPRRYSICRCLLHSI